MRRATESNVEKYLEYVNFIKECSKKSYSPDLVLHRHHIVPRKLWTDETISVNDPSNIVLLSVEDHVTAHILYANAYDSDTIEHIMNMRSARILNRKSIRDVHTLNKITETYVGKNNPFYGKKHNEKTRQILRESTRKLFTDVSYEERYGRNSSIEKEKRRDGVRRSWENMSDEQKEQRRKNISKSLVGKMSGGKNPFATPVIVNGIHYDSIADARKELGVSSYILEKHYEVIKLERKKK
jgi:hypothetical protein